MNNLRGMSCPGSANKLVRRLSYNVGRKVPISAAVSRCGGSGELTMRGLEGGRQHVQGLQGAQRVLPKVGESSLLPRRRGRWSYLGVKGSQVRGRRFKSCQPDRWTFLLTGNSSAVSVAPGMDPRHHTSGRTAAAPAIRIGLGSWRAAAGAVYLRSESPVASSAAGVGKGP